MAIALNFLNGTTSTLLDGARGVHAITLFDRTFLYVASVYEDSVSIFELFPDGSTQFVDVLPDDAATYFNGASGLVSAEVDGFTYLYAVSEVDDTLTALSVGHDGRLTPIQTIFDDPVLELDLPFEDITLARVGSAQFLIVHGYNDDGLSVFAINPDGTLTNTFVVDNASSADTRLNGPTGTTAITIGGRSFVYVSGSFDDAVNIFELQSNGTMTWIDTVVDNATLEINEPRGMAAAYVDGTPYLFVAGSADDGISVFAISGTGALTNVFNIADTTEIALNGARSLEIVTIGADTYLVAAGSVDDGLTLFEVAADGSLTVVDAVFDADEAALTLDDVRGLTVVDVAGATLVIATGLNDDGFSVFELGETPNVIEGTPDADVLFGSTIDDLIDGLAGNDVIAGQRGNDTLTGGEGADLLSGGLGDDVLRGEGDLSQTGSSVVTVSETGQDLALSVTLPQSSATSSLEISGLINRDPATSSDFNIVYVIDVSGSMDDPFLGNETVGDFNGDGASNTLMDGTILAFQSLNQSIIDAGFSGSDVAIVSFQSSASSVYRGSINGSVNATLGGLDAFGGTNFETALQRTISELQNAGPGENRVFFISDGDNNEGGTFLDEVATLTDPNGLNAQITAIGLGSDASLADLDLVDDGIANGSAEIVLEPSTLAAGLLASPVDTAEVDRVEIYVNGLLQRTLDATQFVETPLGLRYTLSVSGLSTTVGDEIEVIMVASDTAQTQVAVTLTVPNALLDFGNDTLLGGEGNDLLFGDAGDDLLFGEMGADTMFGGTGNDSYHVESTLDTVTEFAGEGVDIIYTSVSYILPDFVENLQIESDLNLRGQGNALGNRLTGNSGNDWLDGWDGNDRIEGRAGDDTLWGDNGWDTVFGGTGNDDLYGGVGNDYLDAGSGNDAIYAGDGNDTARGGFGNDYVDGQGGADLLFGGDGDDVIAGGIDFDTIYAGAGSDRVWGDNGRDLIYLQDGNDVFNDNDQDGVFGQDTVWGGNGADTLLGGGGDDQLWGENADDSIAGGDGDDRLGGGAGYDTLIAGAGNDTVWGGNGRDLVRLQDGNDTFWDNGQTGIHAHDTVFGGAGNDVLNGGGGNDALWGEGGDDQIYGGAGNDQLGGGDAYDTIEGGAGNDTVWAGNGRDLSILGDGNDIFWDEFQSGIHAHDTVFGGRGQDTIVARGGNDALTGGDDADVFVFDVTGIAADVITDYTLGVDALRIDADLWGGALTQARLNALSDTSTGTLVLDFGGGNSIRFDGVTSNAGLLDDITLI